MLPNVADGRARGSVAEGSGFVGRPENLTGTQVE
jgi:hypothetical protein